MAGFGLPQPGDFYNRGQQAMTGAGNAAGQMVNLHNINSSNALRHQAMMMDEAYRRDALAQESDVWDRRIAAAGERPSPSGGDRILGGIGGAYGGFMAGNAANSMMSGGGSPWLAVGGAVLGAIGGMSR